MVNDFMLVFMPVPSLHPLKIHGMSLVSVLQGKYVCVCVRTRERK